MNVIRKKQIKYIKLILIAPWLEQTLNLLYVIIMPILAFYFINLGVSSPGFTKYDVTKGIETHFLSPSLKNITSISNFENYVETILQLLYKTKAFPMYIPLGGVRLQKYSISQSNCNTTITCNNCSSSALLETVKNNTKCFGPYSAESSEKNSTFNFGSNSNSSFFDEFVPNLQGRFASYNLISDGQYLDLTLAEFLSNKNLYLNFMNDPNLKFVLVLFNLYSVYTNSYVNVIAGVETLNSFSYINPIFTSSIFDKFDNNNFFLLVLYGLFMGCIVLELLKLIYEMNLKLNLVVHSCLLLHEIINLAVIIFFAFFMTASKNFALDGVEANLNQHNNSHTTNDISIYTNYLSLVSIKSYLIVMVSLAIFCLPFRIISFFSWFKAKAKYLVTYLNVIFRMLPGILLVSATFGLFILSFSFMLFLVYNEYFLEYSSFFPSTISIINLFSSIKNLNTNPKLLHNLNLSPMYIYYNVFLLILIVTIILFAVATYVFLFKKASLLEVKKEEDEVVQKLELIMNKIEALSQTEEKAGDINDYKSRRQIIWLSLTNTNDLYNEKNAENYKIILFNSAAQIIAFLKYLFAIKPNMQFENLETKFAIIVECKSQPGAVTLIRESDVNQIVALFDWLNFAGCKMPVAVHTQFNIERNLRMNISSNYADVQFINTKNEIKEFFDSEVKDYKDYKDYNFKDHKDAFKITNSENKQKIGFYNSRFNLGPYQVSRGPRFTIETAGDSNDAYALLVDESKKIKQSGNDIFYNPGNKFLTGMREKKPFSTSKRSSLIPLEAESILEENSKDDLLSESDST